MHQQNDCIFVKILHVSSLAKVRVTSCVPYNGVVYCWESMLFHRNKFIVITAWVWSVLPVYDDDDYKQSYIIIL